jgi:response regulator RpfG family c-di-GMP phosphodiesterase
MNDRILLVDDDQNLLSSLKRRLRKRFQVKIATGPEQGLEAIATEGPFAVILSDLQMPGMDGIQFLSRVKTLVPDSVRIMLTGNADLQKAIQAVNEGHIYRFLTKPCPIDTLVSILDQAVEHYRLVKVEKELLEKTLQGSIKVLTELLSLLNPDIFGKAARIKRYAGELAKKLNLPDIWKVETAAMLCQIGYIAMPESIIVKFKAGRKLDQKEAVHFQSHPAIAADLISHIPRLEEVADIVACQDYCFNGKGQPEGKRKGADIPIGARILKVVLDFDLIESKGLDKSKIIDTLNRQSDRYDPVVLDAFKEILGIDSRHISKTIHLNELEAGMILHDGLETATGRLLISRGQEISPVMIRRLKNYADHTDIKEPFQVLVLEDVWDEKNTTEEK